uniref:Uncharacterized protein n=1 Tax=Sus scrofa TaxID=9823 RepID=A0A8D0Z6W8_PIG
MVNGMVLLTYLSDFSLLVYRNAICLCVLILYPVTLPITLVQYRNFWVVSLGFSSYCTMSSAKSNTFASSFPICIPFLSFASLIAMARTSESMLNNTGERAHPCSYLSGNNFSFSPLRMMLAVGLSKMPFNILK